MRALRARTETERRATTWYDATEVRVRLNFANRLQRHAPPVRRRLGRLRRRRERHRRRRHRPADGHLATPSTPAPGSTSRSTSAPAARSLITVDRTAGNNAVLSGLFLGGAGAPPPPPPPPPPPTIDIPGVQGNWVGTYGADGYILGAWNGTSTDLASLPAGVTYTLEQGARYSWASPTTDVRALQRPDRTERRAQTWYDATQVRVRLNFANAYSGTLHLYAVDWDAYGRAENVTVDDGTGPRTAGLASAFIDGAWIHVPINVGAGGSVVITADHTAGTQRRPLRPVPRGSGRRPRRPHRHLHPSTDIPGVQGNWVGTYGVGRLHPR